MFNFFKRITKVFFGKNLGVIPGVRPLHRFLFKALRPKKITLLKNVQGSQMYVDPNDTGVAPYLLMHGVYGEHDTALVKELVKPGMIVVDVGANIGYFTLLFSRLVGEDGKVFAFEPDNKNFELLTKNIKVNNLGNIVSEKKALSYKKGLTELYLDKFNLGDMSLSAKNIDDPAGSLQIETVVLDDYLAGKKVDFIKIDVQGAEGMVLAGAKKILQKHKPKIFMEFWPWGLKNLGSDPENLLKMLQGYGYKFKVANAQNFTLREREISEVMGVIKNRKDGRGFLNLLCES